MMKIIVLIILALTLLACNPDEAAELPPAENTAESAVNPVEEPGQEQSLDPDAPATDLGVVTNPDVTLVAPSESVNLQDLPTDQSVDEEGGLITQPAPGVPDPEAKMVQLAAGDLANRLGIDIGEVTLVEVVSREWPDGGLGCPSPDALYAAVITPGFELTFEAEGETYQYHTDMAQTAVLCVDGQPAE